MGLPRGERTAVLGSKNSPTFRQETPPGSSLDRTDLIKELDGTCVMAQQCEAPTDTTELLTRWTWFTLQGFKPATLKSAA